jgi:hypothetical protein
MADAGATERLLDRLSELGTSSKTLGRYAPAPEG